MVPQFIRLSLCLSACPHLISVPLCLSPLCVCASLSVRTPSLSVPVCLHSVCLCASLSVPTLSVSVPLCLPPLHLCLCASLSAPTPSLSVPLCLSPLCLSLCLSVCPHSVSVPLCLSPFCVSSFFPLVVWVLKNKLLTYSVFHPCDFFGHLLHYLTRTYLFPFFFQNYWWAKSFCCNVPWHQMNIFPIPCPLCSLALVFVAWHQMNIFPIPCPLCTWCYPAHLRGHISNPPYIILSNVMNTFIPVLFLMMLSPKRVYKYAYNFFEKWMWWKMLKLQVLLLQQFVTISCLTIVCYSIMFYSSLLQYHVWQ